MDYNIIRQGLEGKFTGNKFALQKLAGIGASYSRLITLDTDVVAPRVFCTGSVSTGKTSAIRELAKLLHVPVVTISGGEISPSGYRGVNLSSGLRALIQQAGSKEQLEQFGGLFHFDELDKLALSSANDKFYENIIYNTFGLLGGETIQVDADEFGNESHQLNTKKIMVVMSGAFAWLNEQSFREPDRAIKTLLRLGFPGEFCSRISGHVHFDKLKLSDVKKIILMRSSIISECFRAGKFTPSINDKTALQIANQVMKNKLGIRSSQRLIEEEFLKQTQSLKELTI